MVGLISLGEVKVYTTEDNAVLRVISYIGLHPTEKSCVGLYTALHACPPKITHQLPEN